MSVDGGPIRRFSDDDQLWTLVGDLAARGHLVVELDASRWHSRSALHHDWAEALDLPEGYGRNLDALADCLHDVTSRWYGLDLDDAGLVVVLDRWAA